MIGAGAAALFALEPGQGVPLLVIGASTGHWLPRAGHWMERIKTVFGVLLLAVALWLLERIYRRRPSWCCGRHCSSSPPLTWVPRRWRTVLQPGAPWSRVWAWCCWFGVLLLVGVAAGGRDLTATVAWDRVCRSVGQRGAKPVVSPDQDLGRCRSGAASGGRAAGAAGFLRRLVRELQGTGAAKPSPTPRCGRRWPKW